MSRTCHSGVQSDLFLDYDVVRHTRENGTMGNISHLFFSSNRKLASDVANLTRQPH